MQDLLPPHVFLNLERFSRERGVECFVRIGNHKWLARLEPEWIAARSPLRARIDTYPLDLDATEFHPWTEEEREAFLGTGGGSGGGFFDHIGRDLPTTDSKPTPPAGGSVHNLRRRRPPRR